MLNILEHFDVEGMGFGTVEGQPQPPLCFPPLVVSSLFACAFVRENRKGFGRDQSDSVVCLLMMAVVVGCAGLHLLTEVMKLGFEDRNTYTGDPAFLDVPVDMLVSKVTTTNTR